MAGRVPQRMMARGLSLLQKEVGTTAKRAPCTCQSGSYMAPKLNARPLINQQVRTDKTDRRTSGVAGSVGSRSIRWGPISRQGRFMDGSERDFSVRASAEAQTVAREEDTTGGAPEGEEKWEIKMLYDGECPLCMREVSAMFPSIALCVGSLRKQRQKIHSLSEMERGLRVVYLIDDDAASRGGLDLAGS
jgi:hypothetical protein